MRLLPRDTPRPRLLDSITGPAWATAPEAVVATPSRAVGNRFVRLVYRSVAAILMLSGVMFWCTRRSAVHDEAVAIRKLIGVGTRMLSSAAHPSMPPAPIVV